MAAITGDLPAGLAEARAAFERAVSFLRAGDAAMAEEIARAALDDFEGEVNLMTLLGAALVRQGRAAEAERWLRHAAETDPDYAKAQEQLGEALLALGRTDEAVDCLHRALAIDPAFESAQLKLGQALLALGRDEEADQVLQAFVQASPHREALARAAALHREGRLEDAEKIYREVLRTDPDNVTAIRLLALIAMKLEHYRDAVILLKRVVSLAPDFRAAWLDLGRAQTEAWDLEDAVATLEQAIQLDPSSYGGYLALANALARSSRTELAVDAYEKAVELRPETAGTYLGLGNVLKTLGRYDEAVSAYRKGIALKPDSAELYWSLSNLKTFRFEPSEIDAMRAALDDPKLSDDATVHFCFALAKALEDAGDYADAFELYRRGNGLRRKQESYDPVHTEVIGERIRAVFTADFLRAHDGEGHRDARPIFIVGLPRSGSTLLEQILASHPQVEATHELPEGGRLIKYVDRLAHREAGRQAGYPEAVAGFPPSRFAELGRRYDDQTRRYRSGAEYFVDKMPNNFANIGLLSLALPGARFVNAMRDPMDTCLSCYKQLFARGQSFTYDLGELADYYLEYRRMMDHWHEVMPGRVLDVRYEAVVDDLEGQVARLLDFCGLPWNDACLEFHRTQRAIRTASSEQVRKPIYSDAVGYWRRFEGDLSELKGILAPVLD